MTMRCLLDFLIVIPVTVFAVLPVRETMSYSRVKSYVSGAALLVCVSLAGTFACAKYALKSRAVLVVNIMVLFAVYLALVSESLTKKLFCLFNSVMLCEFCAMYTKYITAPYELAKVMKIWLPCAVYLGMSVIVGALFFRTLAVKLQVLMNEERIASVWRFMFIAPLVMAVLIRWMSPISPLVIMTGRVRPVAVVLVMFVMASVFMFYHIFWWTTVKLTESARLQQENTFLQMEAKRYDEMQNYMNYSRELRHNFRQHILVITHLAGTGQLDELLEYLSQFTDSVSAGYKVYCMNHAIDAVASHYDRIAREQGTAVTWSLELPADLPVKEADYCAIFGNLIENALNAVKSLPAEKKRVKVVSSMLSKFMTGLSIDNPYTGTITFGKNGLPLSGKEEHGIGLDSVMNTVHRYGGSMDITAEGGTFSVDIILYSNS